MRRKRFHKLAAAVCALALLLSLAPAARAADGPASSSNINRQDYTRWSSTVKSYLFENGSGGLTRVEYLGEGGIVAEDYSSGFQFQSSRAIPMELSVWGGFFAGKDYNFFVFGQNNDSESTGTEVFRIVKYSKDWQRLGQASLYGANTQRPFDAGSLRCAEYGGYLYIRTCHSMFKGSDGLNHQANVMIAVRQSDMTVTDSYYDVFNSSYGYVSHSFNQFILVDQSGHIQALDHGDAYPRAATWSGYYADAGTGKFSGERYGEWCFTGLLQEYAGAVGDNTTGSSIGGLAETSSCYIMAYNYDGQGGGGARNVYFHMARKSDGGGKQYQITSGQDSTTPVLAPMGLGGGYMLWNGKTDGRANDTLYYLAYTAGGVPGQAQSAKGSLSDCQPIYYNGGVVWYVTDNSAPVFYTLDSSGLKRSGASGDNAGTSGDNSGASGDNSGTAGGTFPDVPASHWASAQIQKCMELGIVAGYGDGSFGPGKPVTGAQFATMLDRTFYASQFSSYSANSAYTSKGWYVPALQLASDVGMLRGTSRLASGGGDSWKSSQDANLNRLDMAMMLYNILSANGKAPGSSAQNQAQASISDFSRIPASYQTAVACCVAAGVINGMSDGSFSGNETMTRAQACVVITRMLDAVGNTGDNTGGDNTGGDNGGNGSGSDDSAPVSLAISPATLTLSVGESGSVRAVPSGVEGSPNITYSSSNQAVAAVDSSGVITAKSAGTTVITALMLWKEQLYTATCTLTVKDTGVAKVTISPHALEMTVGERQTISNQLETPDGTIYRSRVSLVSSNPSVVEVHGYEIIAKAPGTAVITGSADWAGKTYTDTCTVTVKEAENKPDSGTDFCAEVVRLVNAERAKAGLSPLGTFDALTAAAQLRAPELITKFDHTRPNGSKCFTALEEAGVSGYYTAGENIAAGQRSPAEVVDGWMNSPGHRANILNPDFTHIGVGYIQGGGGYGHYWVQLFVGVRGNPGGTGNTGSSGTGGTGGTGNTGSTGGTATTPGGRTTHYREDWGNGNYLELQVLNGDTVQFSGCYTTSASYYNYAVLRVFGGESCTPFVSGVPFTVSVKVDLIRLNSFYGGDASKATSHITGMICQNYTPGDSSMAGLSFQNCSAVKLALSASGGVEFEIDA